MTLSFNPFKAPSQDNKNWFFHFISKNELVLCGPKLWQQKHAAHCVWKTQNSILSIEKDRINENSENLKEEISFHVLLKFIHFYFGFVASINCFTEKRGGLAGIQLKWKQTLLLLLFCSSFSKEIQQKESSAIWKLE